MKNIIKKSLQAMLIVPVLALGVATTAGLISAPSASAAGTACPATQSFGANPSGIAGGAGCARGAGQNSDLFGSGSIFQIVSNVLLFIIGAISVIMLIIGGIRYVVSAGDSNAVTGAKNTIMYAVIGIIVALLAYALVNFVLTSFTSSSTT